MNFFIDFVISAGRKPGCRRLNSCSVRSILGLYTKPRQRQSITSKTHNPSGTPAFLTIMVLALAICNLQFFFFKIHSNIYFKSLLSVACSLFAHLQNKRHIQESKDIIQQDKTYIHTYGITTNKLLEKCTKI